VTKNTRSNIIDISKIRDLAREKNEQDAIGKYLGILSFPKLVDEATSLIEELNVTELTKQTFRRSKMMLDQIEKRLYEDSPEYSKKVKIMGEEIKNKFDRL